MQNGSDDQPTVLTLSLLDSVHGKPIQTWNFQGRSQILIGRAEDSDIRFTDPKVSRNHVELAYRSGKWWILSRGRHGTWINGISVEEQVYKDRIIFRLGIDGPSLQMRHLEDSHSINSTIDLDNYDFGQLDFLTVDENLKAKEVDEVVESETFRSLLDESRRIKQQRSDKSSD